MDVRFINPFIKSISNVFQTMMSVDVAFGKPFLQTQNETRPDVSAVIGFSGDASGAVVVAFDRHTAAATASKFAGIDMTLDHADFSDALGELANMIAGGAKADFEGLDVSISLPSVIVGDGHEITGSKAHPSLVIPCDSSLGPMKVHVSMKVQASATVGAA
jgi:chemotaxis protein CheX